MDNGAANSKIEKAPNWYIEPMLELAGQLRELTTWTWLHSGRVARHAVAFGKRLGLSKPDLLALHCAALLHDVGKISIPQELLDKATKLNRDEWYRITKHSMASSRILKEQEIPIRVAAIAQAHHEWFNGKGYPLGLERDAILLEARILSLADAYDAMSSDRPYRPALTAPQIAEELEKGAGTQFDPVLVQMLLPMLSGQVSNVLPTRILRVISDDELLYRQLWFAAYPLGWEIEPWPPAWQQFCPAELSSRTT